MSTYSEAQGIAADALCDPAYEAEVRAAYASLRSERLLSKGGFDLTSATVNGESFAGSVNETKSQLMARLRLAVVMIDAGAVISSKAIPVFPSR